MKYVNFLIAFVIYAIALISPMHAENDPNDTVFDVLRGDYQRLAVAQKFERVTPDKRRRAVRARYEPDPAILAMVDKVADESGIPRSIMRFHVQKESGYDPRARNPKSTATGLLQLIKGSHEVIAGRILTKEEHFRLAMNPEYNLRLGAAHIKECMAHMPGASADTLWRKCHVRGHRSVGGDIRVAATYFKPDSQGWLAKGSVAVPWAAAFANLNNGTTGS